MKLELPKEVKIALLLKGKTFKEWARENGFNENTAFMVATGVIKGERKGTKSYEIKKKIEEELLTECKV